MVSNGTDAPAVGFLSSGLRIQSQNIQINEWLAQLTLCFAPLAAHIFIGVPTLVNRTGHPIPSHKMIPLFNPITILWRYAIIANRRIQFKNKWTPKVMAATNAAFFYEKSLSSSEAKIDQVLVLIQRWPSSTRTAILSISMLGSLIVVFQGVQALYEVTITARHGFMLSQGVGAVFTPLAIVSLFRLIPATWITQDFAFSDEKYCEEDPDIPPINATGQEPRGEDPPQPIQMQALPHRMEVDGDGRNETSKCTPIQSFFKSKVCWASMLFRFGILAVNAAVFVNQCFHITGHHTFGGTQSVSGLLIHFLYHIMTMVMLVLFTIYFMRGKVQDTMIPCINSKWYLIYTVIWYALAVVVVVVNALEMRRTSCGVYTTYSPSSGLDGELCRFYS
ncbi:hypothetical protein B0O99DRAFT_526663 [Bisporella sp. PMI_857]|nr:hypothetical protein B0O99DRAFT_526663 [Bisporella sp. PMI_857]